ncbi:MAG: 50S ribosomal protein L29 [Candidatus Shapirobacteria bacterium]|jgi:ribosomal protein L29|nr:50S ribosomal protein L29 [Candidatus Shapirobacteria bacterium]
MKKTDKISYRQKSSDELKKDLLELRKTLIETNAKYATGNQKDSSIFVKTKRKIALILTLLSEKENEK